jgi:hypothetical protein
MNRESKTKLTTENELDEIARLLCCATVSSDRGFILHRQSVLYAQ